MAKIASPDPWTLCDTEQCDKERTGLRFGRAFRTFPHFRHRVSETLWSCFGLFRTFSALQTGHVWSSPLSRATLPSSSLFSQCLPQTWVIKPGWQRGSKRPLSPSPFGPPLPALSKQGHLRCGLQRMKGQPWLAASPPVQPEDNIFCKWELWFSREKGCAITINYAPLVRNTQALPTLLCCRHKRPKHKIRTDGRTSALDPYFFIIIQGTRDLSDVIYWKWEFEELSFFFLEKNCNF